MNKTKTSTTTNWQGIGYVLQAYSLLAVVSLGFFGIMHLATQHSPWVGYLELAGSMILLSNLILLRTTKRVTFAKNIFLLVVLIFIGLMLVSGGMANTGLLWIYVFPITAFFLSGKHGGKVWMAVLFVLLIGLWLLVETGVEGLRPYSSIVFRQLIISMAVVTVGIYVYQQTREQLVSEGKASKDQLEVEKVRSDAIVQHIAEGIVTTDAEGRVTFMNQMAQELLGWKAEELKGKYFMDMVPMLDEYGREIDPKNRPMYRSLQRAEVMTVNTVYQRKDGTVLHVSATGAPLLIDGKITGVIGTLRDTTEEQDIVRAKSEFVTLASHQLRTPISAIAWVSELLLNGDAGSLTHERQEHIKAIYRSNKRMAALVSEMLIVSGLDLQSLPVIPQKTDLPSLVKSLIKEQLSAHAEQHPTVHEQYDPQLPVFFCDPEIMRMILRNLITNAIKYTPASGEVTVTLTTNHNQKLHAKSKGSIVCTVRDTGYGIPKEATRKIFSKFFRAKNISHRDTDGTGLGLFIVKALLDYVGGRVTFESEEGKGTTFTVLLPIEGMMHYQPQQPEVATTKTKRNLHV